MSGLGPDPHNGQFRPARHLEAGGDFMLPKEAFLVVEDGLHELQAGSFVSWEIDLPARTAG